MNGSPVPNGSFAVTYVIRIPDSPPAGAMEDGGHNGCSPMRRKVVLAVVALALLAIAGAAFGYYMLRVNDPPEGALDTALSGVSVETATEPTTARTTTSEEETGPTEECWKVFGGGPSRSLSRPKIHLGEPTKVLWKRKFSGIMEYPPTFCHGRLYVNLLKGATYALNARTGRILWSRVPGGTASSPAIYGSLLIVSSHDGSVTAYRRENGNKVWRVRTAGKVESSPVVVGDTAYFGSTDGRLFAVDADRGAVRWAYNTGGRINSSPSIWGNRVCISTYAGSVFCLDRRNGRKLWSRYVKRNVLSYESFYASPSTDGARVFTTSRTGKVVAFSARSGRVLWTHDMGSLAYSTPAIAHGRVFVGAFDGTLRCLRAEDGRLLWSISLGGSMLAPAIVVGDLVFAATLNHHAVAARVSDGKIVWRRSKGRYSPGIATDRHYYLSLGSTLYAFRGNRSSPEAD